ncbi:MAG: cbb3-type cytochrome c oxidase N-terminal domain-containing protein [Bdellovibrionota bacterium]
MSDHEDPKSAPLKGEESLLLDHNYDGILELDHPLPRWWLMTFYASIVFAVAYALYYMVGPGPTLRQELQASMNEIELAQASAPKRPDADDEVFVASLNDPNKLKIGAETFAGKCAACHGDQAQGIIGPNLTDDFWINGKGTYQDIAKVVADGVLDKGMPPWGAMLKAEELVHLIAFIRSVRGSNPAGAKESQGEFQKL